MRINIPQTWNDLTDSQLANMALLINSGISGVAFDFTVWKILVNVRWYQLRRFVKKVVIQNTVPVSYFVHEEGNEPRQVGLKAHFDFIYSSVNRTKFPEGIKDNSGKQFYPPLPAIANLTADEFAYADDLAHAFRTKHDFEYLQMLVAVLYSPTHPARTEFNKDILPSLSDSFSNLPKGKLLSVKLAWDGSRTAIEKRFPRAFPKAIATATIKKSKRQGFAVVIRQMCNRDLSKRREIGRINIYTFLEQFQQDIIDASQNPK